MRKDMVNLTEVFVIDSDFHCNAVWFIGKDAAGIALEAINHARDQGIDVVMIDTAGRMQDNEPLMRALAKVSLQYFSSFFFSSSTE